MLLDHTAPKNLACKKYKFCDDHQISGYNSAIRSATKTSDHIPDGSHDQMSILNDGDKINMTAMKELAGCQFQLPCL
jgi:hypothetical protein